MPNLPKVNRIYFCPCSGFGGEGRSASLWIGERDEAECIGHGYGATDGEAVIEALVDSGMTYDDAVDARYKITIGARRERYGF